jgi:biotin synthase
MAKEAGLEVCAGGIIGLGESLQQRVELAGSLRALDVDSIPLNFLNPIPATPLGARPLLRPTEVLATIAMFRFMLPAKEIRICGGREINLRTLQPLMYIAGANGTMIGSYLTTRGRNSAIDIQEIADLGLTSGM